jgi:hypothetical protein
MKDEAWVQCTMRERQGTRDQALTTGKWTKRRRDVGRLTCVFGGAGVSTAAGLLLGVADIFVFPSALRAFTRRC